MVARVAKRLLNQQMADALLEIGNSKAQILSRKETSMAPDFTDLGTDIVALPKTPTSKLKRLPNAPRLPSSTDRESDLEHLAPRKNIRNETALKDCVVDFLNLTFGKGDETDYFWECILLPKISEHFNYTPERSGVNLNALLHALCYHCNLQVNFFKEVQLGREESPFDLNSIDKITHKAKGLSFRNVEYNILANRYEEYREQRNHTLTLQSCNLRLRVSQALNIDPDFYGEPALLADIGEVLLETGDIDGSIKKAKEALIQVHPLSAESVKGWCVLMRALMQKNLVEESLQCFDNALSAIDFHWGIAHPMHASVYSIMAFLYLKKQLFEEALVLFKSSLMCCTKALGANHPYTAEVYMELGNYYSSVGHPNDALSSVEKAFAIYESNDGRKSLQAASSALIIAELTAHLGRKDTTLQMVELCIEIYETHLRGLDMEDPSAQIAASNYKKKLIDALSIGIKMTSRLNDTKRLYYYSEKAWQVTASYQSNKSIEIATEILEFVTKAKITLLPIDQKNQLVTAMLNPKLVCDHESVELVEEFKRVLLTPEFFTLTSQGYLNYLEGLLKEVCEAVRKSQQGVKTDATRALHYLCAIFEVADIDLRQVI